MRSEATEWSAPSASYLAHKDEIDNSIARVLAAGQFILGPEVESFEREFEAFVGTGRALGVSSGTDALELALRVCGVGSGDGVLTVSHTAVATVAAIELVGATPILVDIDPVTYTIDPKLLEETITQFGHGALKAVIPVHLYGCPADMSAIKSICEEHDLRLIEDCAQSCGATLNNVRTGAFGDLAAFSFYPTKNLGALGDGGALLVGEELADRATQLRQYGWKTPFVSEVAGGMNSRLDEVQAAILRVKLKYLDSENARRRELSEVYERTLPARITVPSSPPNVVHAFHQYVIRCKNRESLRNRLLENEVLTRIHYPVPIHEQPAYARRVQIGARGLAHTEKACSEVLSLPMHPHLLDNDVERVARLIAEFVENAE